MVELRYGSATDVGRRAINEDSHLASPPVFVVADGMGGHEAGEVASAVVVEEFSRLVGTDFVTTGQVEQAVAAAQRRIVGIGGDAAPSGGRAGTTMVACLLVRDQATPYWLVVNIGDSRAYRMDQGALERVSVDHSVVQELVDAGQISASEAARHPQRHVVTRVLGASATPDPDYFLLAVESSARVLLCSDGVSGVLDDPRIAALLSTLQQPQEAAAALVAEAVAAGGRDNATAVVVDVVGLGSQRPSLTSVGRRTLGDDEAGDETLKRPRQRLRTSPAE